MAVTVLVVDRPSHRAVVEMGFKRHPADMAYKTPINLAMSPDGRLLASGGLNRSVKLWDLETRQEPRCLRGHDAQVDAVVVTPDGSQAISVSGCGLGLWGNDCFRSVISASIPAKSC